MFQAWYLWQGALDSLVLRLQVTSQHAWAASTFAKWISHLACCHQQSMLVCVRLTVQVTSLPPGWQIRSSLCPFPAPWYPAVCVFLFSLLDCLVVPMDVCWCAGVDSPKRRILCLLEPRVWAEKHGTLSCDAFLACFCIWLYTCARLTLMPP